MCVTIPPKWIWEWGEFFRAQKDCECSIRELGGSCVCVSSGPLGTELWFWADGINTCISNTEVGVKARSAGGQFTIASPAYH